MNATEHRAASYVAQGILNSIDSSVVVDGKWGRYSQERFQKLTAAQRAMIEGVLKSAGYPAPQALYEYRQEVKAAAKAVPATDIVNIVLSAADEFGIDRSLMMATVETESAFNPDAQNGSSRGLGQMQPAAWADARKLAGDLPDYESGWREPRANARATAAYLKLNSLELGKRLTKRGVRVEPWMLYLAHQQGVAGFAQLLELSIDKRPVMTEAQRVRMANNPPQDGKGVTTDPAAFISRWKSVIERRLARHR